MSSEERELKEIRNRIDEIDEAIADLLLKRMKYALEAKKVKEKAKKSASDKRREEDVIKKWGERAKERGLSEEMMKMMAEMVIEHTIKKEGGDR